MATQPNKEKMHENMLHSDREGTFIQAGWPGEQSTFLNLCTRQKLARAGLQYHAHGEARCVVCFCIVKGLKPTSDPWIRHANTNPACPWILLGKRDKNDDYSMREFLDLVRQRQLHMVEAEFQKRKQESAKRLTAVLRSEAALLKERDDAAKAKETPTSSLDSSYCKSGDDDDDE